MNDVFWKDGREATGPWSIIPSWNLPWRRSRRRHGHDTYGLPPGLEYDIGLTDMRPGRPQASR